MPKIDLLGRRFGRWTVISDSASDSNGNAKWLCRCDCGKEKVVVRNSLIAGASNSCGCYNLEIRKKAKTHGQARYNSQSKEYTAYQHMIYRCYNSNCAMYNNYGGRGIEVCDRWRESFENFYDDMGSKPSNAYSLDRLDNNLGYCKENCAWRTYKKQNRNKRDNHWLQYGELKMVLTDWAKRWNVPYQNIQGLLHSKRSFKDIYEHYENGKVLTKIDRSGYLRKSSRIIEVIENGKVVKEYDSISRAVRGEPVSKVKIISHINGIKYYKEHKKDRGKLLKINFDYSSLDKYYRVKE